MTADNINESDPMTAALAYAALDLRIFPCHAVTPGGACTCRDGEACEAKGKHPHIKEWQLQATSDPDKITAWWTRWPGANIGLGMKLNNLVAIDVDERHGGDETMAGIRQNLGTVGDLWTSKTGDGFHLIAAVPPDFHAATKALGPGVDVRWDAYVIAPPSRHYSGKRYEWETDYCPESISEPPPLQPKYLDALQRRPESDSRPLPVRLAERNDDPLILSGERNNTLTSRAGVLRRAGFTAPEIAAALLQMNRDRCDPPLPDDEVEAIARSVGRYAPANDPIPFLGPKPATRFGLVPPFPMNAIPNPAREFIQSAARSIGCPVEFIAGPILAMVGAIAGNGARLQVKTSWVEPAILWAVVVAPPGAAKTPALDAAIEPIRRLQARSMERYAAAMAEYRDALDRWRSTKGKPRGVAPLEPAPLQYLTGDSTVEALARLLTPPDDLAIIGPPVTGLLYAADEGAAWMRSHNQYKAGRGNDRQHWLSFWSGSGLKIDRVGRSAYIRRPVVCVAAGIQPDVLADFRREDGRNDGFVDRLIFLWPDSQPSGWTDDEIDPILMDRMCTLVQPMRRSVDPEQPVMLSDAARATFSAWVDGTKDRISSAESVTLSGWFSKSRSHAARVALVLHVLQHPDSYERERLDQQTIEAAIEITETLALHAARTIGAIDEAAKRGSKQRQPLTLDQRCLGVARRAGGWVSLAAFHEALGGHTDSGLLRDALDRLAEEELLERRRRPQAGPGRPALEWRLPSAESALQSLQGA